MNIQIGDLCWKIYAEGVSSSDIVGKLEDSLIIAMREGRPFSRVIEEWLKDIGMDIHAPSDEVRLGDKVALPLQGGDVVSIGEPGGVTKEDLLAIISSLGAEDAVRDHLYSRFAPLRNVLRVEDMVEAMSALRDFVSELNSRLNTFLEKVLEEGKGCETISDGIDALEGALDASETVIQAVDLILMQDIIKDLGLWDELETWLGEDLEQSLSKPGKMNEILSWLCGKVAAWESSFLDKKERMEQLEKLYRRVLGEYPPENMTEKELISRMISILGPAPEF